MINTIIKPNNVSVNKITFKHLFTFYNKTIIKSHGDLYDRRIVAYRIGKFNNISLVTDTLNEAIAKEKDVKNLITHSDQGFQYTSFEYWLEFYNTKRLKNRKKT